MTHNRQIHCRGRVIDYSTHPAIMGILNVTPDSFSDGGLYIDKDAAIRRAMEMIAQGASVIDVGAESTRPGSSGVPAQQQIDRSIPVIEKIAAQTDTPISIDTSNYQVAQAALQAGAAIVNDITALSDPRIADLAAEYNAAIVLMHIQGSPATMQQNPTYEDVIAEVLEFLLERADLAKSKGIAGQSIIIDPGIGFGKTTEHNLSLLKHIDRFVETGYGVLVGASRKAFIGKITGKDQPEKRVPGTAAVSAILAKSQIAILRVHDIEQNLDAVKITAAITAAP